MRIVPALLRVATVSLVAILSVLLGWLFKSEVGSRAAQLDTAIARSGAAIDACASTVRPETREALRIYLAIEDFFRPTYMRAAEFLVARAGAWIGMDPVGTLGIGQISRQTYLSVAQDGGFTDDAEGWPDSLRDDCASIAVLQLYADKHEVSCSGGAVQCAALLACFWHTGRPDSCAERRDDRSYLANVLTTNERISRVDLRRTGYLPVSDPPDVGVAPQPRSVALQSEKMRPR